MKIDIRFEDGTETIKAITFPYSIGRGKEMDLLIKSWRVAKYHARFIQKESYIYIEDQGALAGTLLNGERIHIGGPLKIKDEIIIGPCLITILSMEAEPDETMNAAKDEDSQPLQLIKEELKARDKSYREKSPPYVVHSVAEDKLKGEADVQEEVKKDSMSEVDVSDNQRRQREIYHLQRLHSAVLERLDLRRRNIVEMSDAALRVEVEMILDVILEQDREIETYFNKHALKRAVLDETVGLGPLEPLLKDDSITEIMVNRFDEIYIERNGLLERTSTVFSSEKAVRGVIDRIVAPIGRRIDESSPMVDARLPDGSRVNAVIPPIALKGSNLTIRKFAHRRPQMAALISLGALDQAMANFLALCVKHRMNIIVSGGTGSGKTTLLNMLSNCIPENERIITIEDAAELKLNHQHLLSLEARPANMEGKGAVSIRDLVRNALRMRPDRIIVGECRGAEAFDTLGAMNTGHEGSLTTLHANSTRDALSRLETMIMMANMDLPLSAIREHISNSIHFIVQQTRLSNGKRVVSSIAEVGGLESGIIKTQELFAYERNQKGAFVGRGIMPAVFERLRQEGEHIDMQLFTQRTVLTSS